MEQVQLAWIANFIWGIADDVLRDLYVRGKYPDVILPMTVLRRLDAVLEPTKQAVLDMKASLDKAKIVHQDQALRQAAGQAFYNTSKFTLRDLKSRASQQQLKADFEAYLDGFSPNVQDILENFEFRNQIPRLSKADAVGTLIEKLLSPEINLSPKPVLNGDGSVNHPGLDNHAMGTIFEELVRRFNEENNEEAGEHWTPRDAVKLMAKLVFLPIADEIESGTYLLYDGACGTGGMLTVGEETLQQVASEHGKQVATHLYGQDINAEIYAICKGDLLLKGEGDEADNIVGGPEHSTLSNDAFHSREFDFMLSNPPYGKSWKTDLERMGGKEGIKDLRFVIEHAGDSEYSLITRSSDGQMLFLANMLSKMKHGTKLGSRIAEVHNGSSLFTGDAGQGESNIRRWIIENDWLEAIVALPLNMFYNTGIATYIWVLSNRKPEHRAGRVQLIDATQWYKPLRKNLGKKNCELAEEDIQRICDTFLGFKETAQSKIFPNAAFGYWKITIERPLRLKVDLGEERRLGFRDVCVAADEEPIANVVDRVALSLGPGPHLDFNLFMEAVEADVEKHGVKLTAKRKKMVQMNLAERDESAREVIARLYKSGNVEPDPLRGLFATTIDCKPAVVEYEPDPDLRDTEQVQLLEEGGIDAFLRREVLPHAPDTWYDPESVRTGYEVSFTRYFYKPQPLRTLDEIRADIMALEKETEGLLGEMVGADEMSTAKRRGFSVRVFLPDGDPDGIKVVEKSNWTGSGLVAPRALFGEVKGRAEMGRAGVYILFGQEGDSPLPRIYVGEGDPVRPRLEQHAKTKDFWTHAVLFTSKDQTLNKAHVQYLEAKLVALATVAKRSMLDNGNVPQLPSLSESDVSEVEGFLDDVLLCLPILGYSFFESAPTILPEGLEFQLKVKGLNGRGYETSQVFIVKKGSQAAKGETAAIPRYVTDIRAELIRQGVLRDIKSAYEFTQNYTFGSPSTASAVLLGRTSNGRIEWRTADGRTLKSIQDAVVGE